MSTATASTSNVTLEQSLAPSRTSPDSAAIRSTPASSPTSAAPLSTQRPRKRAKLDRDSLEYALTSGFAGGIAGESLAL